MRKRENLDDALRYALKKRHPLPNVSAYSNSTSWDAINGWNGRMELSRKDPIFTPLFTSLLGAGGLGFFSGSALSTAAGIASAIATTAVVPGIQVLM